MGQAGKCSQSVDICNYSNNCYLSIRFFLFFSDEQMVFGDAANDLKGSLCNQNFTEREEKICFVTEVETLEQMSNWGGID